MRRKTTKEILAESFREIGAKKPVDKITVPDITENCGYSKTTFYRLFKEQREHLKNLLLHTGGYGSFSEYGTI